MCVCVCATSFSYGQGGRMCVISLSYGQTSWSCVWREQNDVFSSLFMYKISKHTKA